MRTVITHGALFLCSASRSRINRGIHMVETISAQSSECKSYVIKVISNFYSIHLNNLTNVSLVAFVRKLLGYDTFCCHSDLFDFSYRLTDDLRPLLQAKPLSKEES
eukprot:GHVR01137731.1.p2 GENE.GHVR01137731.1~~GHVR01137731.1.p2  ORF type:complete len:106 (+),score=8.24 GHVR01137731.1:722-1039(+)